MSETTPRMLAPFPSRETDPWFDAFVDYVNAVDSSQYAYREDRHIIFAGGGTLAWDATTGVLSWDADIRILAAVTGYQWIIEDGSVTIDPTNGIIFYATLDRGPGENTTVATATVNKLGSISPDNVLAIAVRIGDTLYFRSGLVLEDGATATGIAPGGGGGGGGGVFTAALAYSYTEAASPVQEVMGQITYDGSLSATANFLSVINPTLTTGTCSIRLYDLGPAAAPSGSRLVATLTASASGLQRLQQMLTAVASSPVTNEILQADHIYEVRVTSAAQVGDSVYVGSAKIEVQ